MDLRHSLSRTFADTYPGEAAGVLEHRSAEEVAGVLSMLPPDVAANVLERMAPIAAASAVERLKAGDAAAIFAQLKLDAALPLLRNVTQECRAEILEALPKEHADAVSAVIGFPHGTAGALMDPRLLAVPSDLTVEDAVKAVRREAASAHYNLYVIDRGRVLVGVLNLHELMYADPKKRLEEIMKPPIYRLEAGDDSHKIISHPGWRQVHSLPVVDREGRFLGAIRYRIFRRIEAEIRGEDTVREVKTAQALGDLFGTGLGGLIDVIASVVSPGGRALPGTQRRPRPFEE
jgi:magnesium transporter